jgi:hypothetical protein
MDQRLLLPLHRQKSALRVHPNGQLPFGGNGIASCAP